MFTKQLSQRVQAEIRPGELRFTFRPAARQEESKPKGKQTKKQESITFALTFEEAFNLFGLLYDNIDMIIDAVQERHQQK